MLVPETETARKKDLHAPSTDNPQGVHRIGDHAIILGRA